MHSPRRPRTPPAATSLPLIAQRTLWTRWTASIALFALPTTVAACADLTRPGDEPPPVAAIDERPSEHVAGAAAAAPPPAKDFPAEEAPPQEIRASHILVGYAGTPRSEQKRTKEQARARAEELLARLKKGEDFGKLAGEYGEDGTKLKGGDLGTFGHGQMVPPFEAAAFALRKGETSGIVETQFGFHVIKRTE